MRLKHNQPVNENIVTNYFDLRIYGRHPFTLQLLDVAMPHPKSASGDSSCKSDGPGLWADC